LSSDVGGSACSVQGHRPAPIARCNWAPLPRRVPPTTRQRVRRRVDIEGTTWPMRERRAVYGDPFRDLTRSEGRFVKRRCPTRLGGVMAALRSRRSSQHPDGIFDRLALLGPAGTSLEAAGSRVIGPVFHTILRKARVHGTNRVAFAVGTIHSPRKPPRVGECGCRVVARSTSHRAVLVVEQPPSQR
jgi:hypothetical protein